MANQTNRPFRGSPNSTSRRPSGGAPHARRQRAAAREASPDPARYLFGIHPIDAALRNPNRVIHKLRLTDNAEHRLAEALACRDGAVSIERVRPKDLDQLLGTDTVHQGAAAEVEPLAETTLSAVADATAQSEGTLMVLDHVTDPHNVGAILRSSAVFGAAAVVMTRRHSPPLGGVLAKSASGALDLIPVVLVQNLGDALEELAGLGVRIIGLDGEGTTALDDADLSGPVALVLGAEGKGLRQRTKALCHSVCRIEAPGQIASLNVSNAAAVSLHLASMRRK